jgi:hypothetical protein
VCRVLYLCVYVCLTCRVTCVCVVLFVQTHVFPMRITVNESIYSKSLKDLCGSHYPARIPRYSDPRQPYQEDNFSCLHYHCTEEYKNTSASTRPATASLPFPKGYEPVFFQGPGHEPKPQTMRECQYPSLD